MVKCDEELLVTLKGCHACGAAAPSRSICEDAPNTLQLKGKVLSALDRRRLAHAELSPAPDQSVMVTLIKLGRHHAGMSEHLCVEGVGSKLGITKEELQVLFELYGGQVVQLESWKAFVSFGDAAAASRAKIDLDSTVHVPHGVFNVKLGQPPTSRRLYVQLAGLQDADKPCCPPEPPCTSVTDGVQVPGLRLVTDFITSDDEAELMSHFDQEDKWDDMHVHRRVQHYGVAIDFKARRLDHDRPVPEVPPVCLPLLHRFVSEGYVEDLPNQLTVNEYVAGQGISSHIDVHSLFGDVFLFLSLGSGLVMDFKAPVPGGDHVQHKALWLPPRSLVVLGGEARYRWSHGIASRKSDKVNGELRPRGRRVSLSFRSIRRPPVCTCPFPEFCNTQSTQILHA